jgi:RNA polymerase sigma-70 factor, ECF subfamily
MEESDLIQAAKSGDLEAFNKLVLAYQTLAYNLALRMLSDEDAAQDATQIAFISAYRSLHNYRGGSFRAWVLRMVTNTCYDELRRHHRHPTISLEQSTNDDQDEVESPRWLADDRPSPEQSLELADLEHAISHCLDHLPPDFRAVVIMVDLEGLDYQEVSKVVNKPLGTIKSRLARARLRLRDCLTSFGELLPAQFRLQDKDQP